MWLRHLRGTPLDPFGYTEMRRSERALRHWYLEVLGELARTLEPPRLAQAVEIAAAPAGIRGYETLKTQRMARIRDEVAGQLARLTAAVAEEGDSV